MRNYYIDSFLTIVYLIFFSILSNELVKFFIRIIEISALVCCMLFILDVSIHSYKFYLVLFIVSMSSAISTWYNLKLLKNGK